MPYEESYIIKCPYCCWKLQKLAVSDFYYLKDRNETITCIKCKKKFLVTEEARTISPKIASEAPSRRVDPFEEKIAESLKRKGNHSHG